MSFRFVKFKVYQDAKRLHRKIVFLISEAQYKEAVSLCEDVVNQLGGFSKKLKVSG